MFVVDFVKKVAREYRRSAEPAISERNPKIHDPQPAIFASSYYRDLTGLEPSPIVKDWIVEGAPEATARMLMEARDGISYTVVWDCTAGSFRWRYGRDETVFIVSGEVFITDDSGEERRLGEGDMAFFPAGSSAMWRVPTRVRKLAVLRRITVPHSLVFILRAWNSLKSLVATDLGALGLLGWRRKRKAQAGV
jgi:uncharacterized cupin superfamily protein